MEIQIYGKNGEKRCVVTAITYNGEWMSECFVTFDVESAVPVPFAYGDWLIYRGERFELHYEPEVTKKAMDDTYGEAYVYENVKFVSLAEELVNCDFLDYVLNDNEYHFSGLPEFSFYAETVKDLADRIQANMNRFSEQNGTPPWEVTVAQGCGGNTRLNISASNISCHDALSMAQSEFNVNFIIRGRQVTIGKEGVPATHIFRMGKDIAGNLNGLYEFSRTADSDQKIVTRLRAYGSDRNLPRRYYNSLTDADGVKMVPDNMAVNRLMLPDFPDKTLDPYIDSDNISQLGVIEDTVIFDGSGDLQEIYPSIEEATAEELKASGSQTTATGRLDEIVEAQQIEDDGIGREQNGEIIPDTETFTITIKDIGFDINDYLTDQSPQISFKTGMLGGRDFNIRTASSKPVQNSDKTWTLTLERVYDEGIGLWFPYSRYNAKPQDQFVILGIDMPESYIKMASQRLLSAARDYLQSNDYARSVFNPKVDEIFMARQHQRFLEGHETDSIYLSLKEGDMLMFEEESLGVGLSTIFIDKLSIEEGKGPVPTFEITLREEKSVGTLQRIQNQIDSIRSGASNGSGGYTSEQLRQLLKAIGSQLFISKIANDGTPYNLTVGGLLSALAGIVTGEYLKGESGAFISSLGYAEFAEIFARDIVKAGGGAEFGDYVKGFLGAAITAQGDAELSSLLVRKDGIFEGALSSRNFIGGFIDGMGWALTERTETDSSGNESKKYTFEVDDLIVRNTLRIFEMVVSQLVGENDNRVFTSSLKVDHYDAETGIIWLDTQGGSFYNPFRKDDYIEVQQYNGLADNSVNGYLTKSYSFFVTETGIGGLSEGADRLDWIKFRDFSTDMQAAGPSDLISKGDTLVRMDNDSDSSRKGIITITSTGDNTPHIDVIYGLKTNPQDSLKGRLGNLEGIRHHLFGWLEGFGAFLSNLYAVGDFRIARTGDSIDTQLEILKERFSSQYSQITYDITEDDNFLVNPSFTEDLAYWEISKDASQLLIDEEGAFLVNGNFFIADSYEGQTTHRAALADYEGRKMLYLYDSGLTQKNGDILAKIDRLGKKLTHLEYDTDFIVDQSTEGITTKSEEKPNTLYLNIKILAVTSGILKIGFTDAEGTLPGPAEIEIEKSREWQTLEWEGTWNGQGDFILEYSAEAYVSFLSLTDNPLGDYRNEIGTRIEQTAKNIKLLGWNIDNSNKRITDLEFDMNSEEGKISIMARETNKIGSIEQTISTWTPHMIKMEAYSNTYLDAEGNPDLAGFRNAGIAISSDLVELYATKDSVFGENGLQQELEGKLTVESDRITQMVSDLYVTDGRRTKTRVSVVELTLDAIKFTVEQLEENGTVYSSQIAQNARNIDLKVGYDDVIAAINLSTESEDGSEIRIQADKISLTGYTEINNFIIDKEGNVAVNGDVTLRTLGYTLNTATDENVGPANGFLSLNTNLVQLPEIKEDEVRIFRIFNPVITRSTPADLVVKTTNRNDFISNGINTSSMDMSVGEITIEGGGNNSGCLFEVMGMTILGRTTWYIVKLNKD